MTVGKTSQSLPSNVIIHDGDANLPARIYSFECIGFWSRVTAKPGNLIESKLELVGLIQLTKWIIACQAGWKCQSRDPREVVVNGSECCSARPGICAFVSSSLLRGYVWGGLLDSVSSRFPNFIVLFGLRSLKLAIGVA